jgi:hypothetical protein
MRQDIAREVNSGLKNPAPDAQAGALRVAAHAPAAGRTASPVGQYAGRPLRRHGMPDNYRALSGFRQAARNVRLACLWRCSQNSRSMAGDHVPGSNGTLPSAHASRHPSPVGANGVTRVTLEKSRVRESHPPGSVRAQAKWLSYSTTTHLMPSYGRSPCRCANLLASMAWTPWRQPDCRGRAAIWSYPYREITAPRSCGRTGNAFSAERGA